MSFVEGKAHMGKIRKCFLFVLALLFVMVSISRAQAPAGDSGPGVLVGRIVHIEGQLLRYVPEEQDWVATVKDAPFGLNDSLYSEAKARGEFIMPNGTWARIAGSTQIQLITLQTDVTEVDVASGAARLFNRTANGLIKATTPFGYVVAPAGTVFDLYVGDRSLEVVSLKGTVDFILNSDKTKYKVIAGSHSIVSDGQQVTSGQGNVDAEWDDWNADRDRLWSQKMEVRGESVQHLPPDLHDDSYDLDENGKWEQVYYEGGYRWFWRPVTVSAGWAPYTVGRWTVYYGDNCWVPYEPFGYVTHHYGNWVFVNSCNCWYWAPPVVGFRARAGPFPDIPFGWTPGRVAWIYSGYNIGWIPLAPFEPYYGYRHWGPRTMIVNNINIANININRYQYINRAVVVYQKNFYNVNNYQNIMLANINKHIIINNYRPTPVIDNKVIRNYNSIHEKYNFTNVKVNRKPSDVVLNRIARNEQLAKQTGRLSANVIQHDVAGLEPGRLLREARIETPKVTEKLVSRNEASKPGSVPQPQQRELKVQSKPPSQVMTGQVQSPNGLPGKITSEGQPGGPSGSKTLPLPGERQKVMPLKPGPSAHSGEQHQKVTPIKPGVETPPATSGQVKPVPEVGQRVSLPAPKPDSRHPQVNPPGQPGNQGQRINPLHPRGEKRPSEPSSITPPSRETQRPQSPIVGPGSRPPDSRPMKSPVEERKNVRPSQEQLRPGGVGEASRKGQPMPEQPRTHIQKKPVAKPAEPATPPGAIPSQPPQAESGKGSERFLQQPAPSIPQVPMKGR
jgi:hypothetical protein